jgi:hypothetical protein
MLIEEILILTDGIKLIHLKICFFDKHKRCKEEGYF